MKANRDLEMFSTTVNDLCDNLPKGRGRCFDIGTNGGCGVLCAAFVDGECGEPQEISKDDIINEHGEEDAKEIMSQYNCFTDPDQ
jgi:hypothetical protein